MKVLARLLPIGYNGRNGPPFVSFGEQRLEHCWWQVRKKPMTLQPSGVKALPWYSPETRLGTGNI
jgi:hypothetical protein